MTSDLRSPIEFDAREARFSGTDVPIRVVFDRFAAGDRIDDILRAYPSLHLRQIIAILRLAQQGTLAHASVVARDVITP